MTAFPDDRANGLPPQDAQQPAMPQPPSYHDVGQPGHTAHPGPVPHGYAEVVYPQTPQQAADYTYRAQVFDPAAPPAQPVLVAQPAASRNAFAMVVTFLVVVIGMWAVISYLNQVTDTLASVDATNQKMVVQLRSAREGVNNLNRQTSVVAEMYQSAKELDRMMAQIDGSMSTMVSGVESVGTQMNSMNSSLGTIRDEVAAVQKSNETLVPTLQKINSSLKTQGRHVGALRKDINATANELERAPHLLQVTNARLTFINATVCLMGKSGVTNSIRIAIDFLGLPTGSATISATLIPPGAWRC